jgi:hypothetical protein
VYADLVKEDGTHVQTMTTTASGERVPKGLLPILRELGAPAQVLHAGKEAMVAYAKTLYPFASIQPLLTHTLAELGRSKGQSDRFTSTFLPKFHWCVRTLLTQIAHPLHLAGPGGTNCALSVCCDSTQ